MRRERLRHRSEVGLEVRRSNLKERSLNYERPDRALSNKLGRIRGLFSPADYPRRTSGVSNQGSFDFSRAIREDSSRQDDALILFSVQSVCVSLCGLLCWDQCRYGYKRWPSVPISSRIRIGIRCRGNGRTTAHRIGIAVQLDPEIDASSSDKNFRRRVP